MPLINIPLVTWIIVGTGVAISLILLVFYLGKLLQFLSWALFIVASIFGTGVLFSLYGEIKESIKSIKKLKGGDSDANK